MCLLCRGREAQPRVLGFACLAVRGRHGAPGDALLQQDGGMLVAREGERRERRARAGQVQTRPGRCGASGHGHSCDRGDLSVSTFTFCV